MNPEQPVTAFRGAYAFLGNFAQVPGGLTYNDQRYPTVENAYQAAKTLDVRIRAEFSSITPADAKYKGRTVCLRSDWESIKLTVMRDLLWIKFSDPSLRKKLLATGDRILLEGNNWRDTFWGVYRGFGDNHLGRLLMQIRREIREADANM